MTPTAIATPQTFASLSAPKAGGLTWTGRVLTALTGFFLLTSGINVAFVRSPEVAEGFAKFGYSPSVMFGIGMAALIGAVLYLIPRTTVLGAIVLTGYLGGA